MLIMEIISSINAIILFQIWYEIKLITNQESRAKLTALSRGWLYIVNLKCRFENCSTSNGCAAGNNTIPIFKAGNMHERDFRENPI